MDKKTVELKDSAWTFEDGEDSALDRLQSETPVEEIQQMTLQDFLIALNEAEKAEAAEQEGEQKRD